MRLTAAKFAGCLLTTAVVATTAAPGALAEPPQFGVEVEAGTAAGVSSYLRNEVVTDTDRTATDAQGRYLLEPSLADVQTGTGTSLAVRLVASNISAGLSLRWFDLDANQIHHRGRQSISASRMRPDGSIDDSGVDYTTLSPPLDRPIPQQAQDQLFVFGLGGDYRFLWPGEAFDFFVPVGAELVVTHVTRDAAPYRLGLQVSSGLGVSVEFLSGVALLVDARLNALATPHYGRREDAARRAVEIGDTTEEAFFSTLVYAGANVAIQFKIR